MPRLPSCRIIPMLRSRLAAAAYKRPLTVRVVVGCILAIVIIIIVSVPRVEHRLSWEQQQEPLNAADLLRAENRARLKQTGNGTLLYPSYEAAEVQSNTTDGSSRKTSLPRIVCWVMTTVENLSTRGAAVNSTWLRHCDVGLFMSSASNPDPAVINIVTKDERWRLPFKTMRAFKYVYDHHFRDGDWFLKADDDTYVVVDNLRRMLSNHSPADPVYFGHRFKMFVKPQGYASGGAGYVLSKQALFRFAEYGYKVPGVCTVANENEDLVFGECMQNLSVSLLDSRDSSGRLRFHAYRATEHLANHMGREYPDYDYYDAATGVKATSPYAITFHYVTPEEMFLFEYFAYHFRRDGEVSATVHAVNDRNEPAT